MWTCIFTLYFAWQIFFKQAVLSLTLGMFITGLIVDSQYFTSVSKMEATVTVIKLIFPEGKKEMK